MRSDAPAVLDYLAYVELVANDADQESVTLVARSEMLRMSDALRALLAAHSPNRHGRCRRCAPWWRPWHRHVPCDIWELADQRLVAASPFAPTGPVRVIGGPR